MGPQTLEARVGVRCARPCGDLRWLLRPRAQRDERIRFVTLHKGKVRFNVGFERLVGGRGQKGGAAALGSPLLVYNSTPLSLHSRVSGPGRSVGQ